MQNLAKKFKLSNGLTVIYEKNSNAKIVSLNVGVRVGAVHEADHESGICHLIEHMVFKGTKTYAPGEIATTVEANGGELNAYTSVDQTVYYINLPSEHFALGLNILKEMVFDAQMDALELSREKEVVVEEILRGQDSPQRVLNELLFKNFFTKHNYGRPVIGTAELVRGFSSEKILGFYKKHYVPSNMILGICGDVEESQVNLLIEKLFRFEMASPRVEEKISKAVPPAKFQYVKKSMEIQTTLFDLAFPAVPLDHDDVPALDALSHLLGEGGASLLEQNTKEKEQLVQYIYSGSFTPRYEGVFFVGAQTETKKLQPALESVVKQIRHICTHPVAQADLDRVKLLATAQIIYDKQTCEGTAKKWMSYETTVGNYLFDEKYLETMAALTPEDILQTAQKYLQLELSTLAVLHPKKDNPKVDTKIFQIPKARQKIFKAKKERLGVGVYTLDNGIRVLVKENHRLPLFSLKMVAEGGLRYETPKTNGWFSLMTSVMTKGFAEYDQKDIAEKCESLAASLSAYSGRNSMGVSLSGLSQKWHESLAFATDLVCQPTFAADELQKERNLQLEAIKNRQDNPAQMAFLNNMQRLFGKHPYGMSTMGEKASVLKTTPQNLKNLYESFRVPANMVVSVVGDVKAQAVLESLNQTLGQIAKKTFKPQQAKAAIKVAPTKAQIIKQNKNQSHLVLGFLGSNILSPDRYALEVLNHVFSGQGGRLFLELRDKQSLAYTVSSTLIEGLDTGFFGVYIGTEPTKVQKALDGIYLELQKAQDNFISEAELARAKNYIIGNHAIDHQKNGDVAMELALNELYHKPLEALSTYEDKIRQVTLRDVQRVAQKYITLKNAVLTVVGPNKQIVLPKA